MAKESKSSKQVSGVTLKRQLIFWFISLLIFVAIFWLLSDVLLPFIVAMALAYLLDPLVVRLQKLGINRTFAAIIIMLVAIALIALAVILIVPLLGQQLHALIEKLPGYFEKVQQIVASSNQTWLGKFVGDKLPDAQKQLGGFAGQAATWFASLLGSLLAGGRALLSALSLIVITPVVAFYLLLDWDRMVANIDKYVPRDYVANVHQIMREIDQAIAGFIRGQGSLCLILGIWYAVGLSLVGLNFGLLIGLFAGMISFIPYVGSTVGLIAAVGVALVQFWPDYIWVGAVLAVFFSGQFMEGNILQPKLVGHSVGLHPVWLMFALFAFGALFGFVGLLVAVPAAAAVGVLVRFALSRYLESDLYAGEAKATPVRKTKAGPK